MRTIIALILVALFGCKTNNKATQAKTETQEFSPQYVTGVHAMVYKTKANYNNLIPVELSDDKTKIVSYPGPGDVRSQDGYQTPTPLNKGYLLDNRGIGKNTAFLKMTYEEYAKLQTAPTVQELFNMIIEKDPLTELVDCGNKTAFKNITAQLNQLIDGNKLRTTCKVIK